DSPPFLGTGKHDRPRAPQQRSLVVFRDEPAKPHRIAETQRLDHPLESRPIVALAADVERDVGMHLAGRRERAQRVLHSFITLQSAEVQKRRAGGAWRGGVWSVRTR